MHANSHSIFSKHNINRNNLVSSYVLNNKIAKYDLLVYKIHDSTFGTPFSDHTVMSMMNMSTNQHL